METKKRWGTFDLCSGPKDSAEEHQVKEEVDTNQACPYEEGGEEAPETRTVNLDRILTRISALVSYVALLQVQSYKD